MYRRRKGTATSSTTSGSRDPSQRPSDSFDSVPATPPPASSQVPSSSPTVESFENDTSVINEKEFRRALDRCYTQSQNANVCKLNLDKVPARNAFEKLLEQLGAELRTNSDDELSVYLKNTFHDLVKELDIYCEDDEKRTEFFRLFEEEIVEEAKLRIYLSPAATESGYVDTFIRALLTSKSSQAATFELILKKIETYAKSMSDDSVANDRLALACIAQFRYVDAIFDCKRVFNAVFDCDLENWRCTPRDALIQAVPEFLPSPAVQQDTANNMQQMFLKNVLDNSLAFRITILQTLILLRTNEHTTSSIRGILLQNVMKVELEVLPELLKYCLGSVQRNEKFAFRNILYSLRAHLQIENLKSTEKGANRKTVGQVLSDIFEAILKKMKAGDGRYWKDAVTVLSTEGQQQNDEENDSDVAESAEDFVPVAKKEMVLFDVLFCFALMDAENWGRTIHSFFKQQISCNRHFQLEKLVAQVFEYKEFITRFFQPILDFWKTLMWSPMPIYCQFGAFGYKTLFIKLPSKQAVIFKSMVQHLNEMEQETTAMLITLQDIANSYNEDVAVFFPILSKKLPCLTNFSFENVCRFFNILLTVERTNEQSQITEQQQGLSAEIERMISSSSTREKIWGILGVLMQLQQYLVNKRLNAEDRENMIKQKLALLDERTKDDAYLRTCFYEYFARILNSASGIEYSTILVAWSERLCLEFKSDFLKQCDRTSANHRLEDERYTNPLHKEWLCLSELVMDSSKERPDPGYRIFKPVAHFQLLLALTKLKHSWAEEQHNEDFLAELLFVLEANISMTGIDLETRDSQRRILNCDIFFFCIQWIRSILNTFAASKKISGADPEAVQDILRKNFALMIECQKSLKYTIQKIGEYQMPCMENTDRSKVVIYHDIPKKPSNIKKKKKRANNERNENIEEDEENVEKEMGDGENEGNEAGDKENTDGKTTRTSETEAFERVITKKNLGLQKLIDVRHLGSCFVPLNFTPVIRLIELLPKKRKQTTFLLETLHKLLEQILPKKDKKILPLLAAQEGVINGKPLEENPKILWRSIQSVMPTLFAILHGTVDYFKNLLETSIVLDSSKRSYHTDMDILMHSSLVVFHDIFSSKDLMKTSRNDSADEERSQRLRTERRKLVMEKLERAMIDAEAVEDTQGVEDTEVVVSSYFISISEIMPSLDSAVALLQLLSCDFVSTSQKAKVAKLALSYLKKEWTDAEENPVKGAPLNRAVASILRSYLSFRGETERLAAIQWMLANKISELVPEEERRRSKISSLEPCHDKALDETEASCSFICFNRATFGSIYKVLFGSLNETIKSVLPLQAVEKGTLRQDDCFALWKTAASSFCLLTLLIRVKIKLSRGAEMFWNEFCPDIWRPDFLRKTFYGLYFPKRETELRNASVLLTAAREGRLFLQNFVIKSSFMFLLSGETRFAKYGTGANAVLKTVQIGNRSLQNMSAHAKSTKCASLLKLLPQLRTASEQFIRAVQKLMIGVDCDEAFQIGLLKSRNLDGEELKEVEMEEDSATEDSQQGPITDEGENENMEVAEEQSDVEMGLEDDSPIF